MSKRIQIAKILVPAILFILFAACSNIYVPNPQIVPTAQHLLQNPPPRPNFLSDIEIYNNGILEQICITIFSERTDIDLMTNEPEFFINNQPLPLSALPIRASFIDGAFRYCFEVDLETGVHLIEVRIDLPSDEHFSYQWGLNIP